MFKCKVKDCKLNKHQAFGYCNTHYQRFYRTGDPLKGKTYERHGLERSKEYASWLNMKQRCTNPKNDRYKDYGGRGITICSQWLNSFVTFYKDMGKCPPKLTLERIDVNGNYEPLNCEWASRQQQSINQRVRKDNKIGIKGVFFDKKGSRWVAYISRNKKHVHLGSFQSVDQAISARQQAEIGMA